MEPEAFSLRDPDPPPWEAPGIAVEDDMAAEHPAIASMLAFEHEFMDRLLHHVASQSSGRIELVDIGCGIGRLHYRYGIKTADPRSASLSDSIRLERIRSKDPSLAFDPDLAARLARVSGVDFSAHQLSRVEGRLVEAGLSNMLRSRLLMRTGSIQSLQLQFPETMPLVVSMCNSIGLFPSPNGAAALFRSVRRMVEPSKGMAVISAFRRGAVATHALPLYESLIHLFGQARWLHPGEFVGMRYRQKAQRHKSVRDPDQTVVVDVYDCDGNLVKEQHTLTRIPDEVAKAVGTGHIRTVGDYHTHWYGEEQVAAWMQEHWAGLRHYHLAGKRLDPERGEAIQLAVLDASGLFDGLLESWA